MVKKLLTYLVRTIKNKNFEFDENIPLSIFFSLMWKKSVLLIRGYRLIFFGVKTNLLFLGKGVEFFYLKNIKIGSSVSIGDFVYISGLGKEGLSIGNRVNIAAFSRVIVSSSFQNIGKSIKIGNDVAIGEFSHLGGAGGLEIGDDTIIGPYFSTHPENHNYQDQDLLIREQGVNRKGIKIGSNCWIGSKVTILDGVSIGDKCIIAAGTVVTKSFPSDVLIGGVPAKILKELN